MVDTGSAQTDLCGKAVARIEVRPIKTYAWDAPSRYPILFGAGYRFIYPYTMEDRLSHRPEERPYRQVVLENEFIQVIVLPELGGHLWRALDKVSGKEMFYNNHVVKPGLISLRGAWCATGIEWNFPIGHSVSTVATVDHDVQENADGSVSAIVGDVDRTTRMKWTVKITVFPDQLAFRVDTVLSNPTTYPHRYMYWENAAMHATDGFQFIAPAKKAWTWGGKTDFPIVDGVDKSWYIAHPRAIDYFALGLGQDYFGYYDHRRSFGAVHVADYNLMPGKKFFTWGMAANARQWEKNLTDAEGPYIELQCGLTPTQAFFNFFPPQTSIRWDEMWFPIGDLGYFAFANREAALHLSDRLEKPPYPADLEIALVTNRPRPRSTVKVAAAGRTLFMKDGVDFAAGVPRRWKIELPAGTGNVDVTLEQDGAAVLEYSTRDWENIRELEYKNPRELANVEDAPPRTLLDAAIANLKWFNYRKAMSLVDKALAARPSFTDARYWRGNILYNLFNYGEALEELSKVGPRNANYAAARYLVAEIHRYEGRFDEALAVAGKLAARDDAAVMAASLSGRMAMQQGNFSAAAARLAEAGASDRSAPFVTSLLAAALRRCCRTAEAEESARAALEIDPLDYLALNELELLGCPSGRDRIMRGQVESYIELASWYEDVFLFEEAAQVLESCRAACGSVCHPLVYYHLARCNAMLSRHVEAEAFYAAAAAAPADNVFPFRREDILALEAAVARDAGDSLAHYLLGTFLAWKLHVDEALAHWETALAGMPDYSVLLRNVGKLHLSVAQDYSRAAGFYERAINAAPGDEELYAEADEAYAKLGDIEKRVVSLETGLVALPSSQKVRKLLSQCYYFAGRYDDAIDLLMSSEFDHWEGDRMGHQIYVRSCIEKGRLLLASGDHAQAIACFRAAMEYPANLKVGKPAFPGHAPQLYLLGLAYQSLGDHHQARAVWTEGAEEVHEGWIGHGSEEEYYKALCLITLGRKRDARRIWREMTKGVAFHWGNVEWYAKFIEGLGWQGLEEWDKAEQCLLQSFEVDRANRKVQYHLELVREHRQAGA